MGPFLLSSVLSWRKLTMNPDYPLAMQMPALTSYLRALCKVDEVEDKGWKCIGWKPTSDTQTWAWLNGWATPSFISLGLLQSKRKARWSVLTSLTSKKGQQCKAMKWIDNRWKDAPACACVACSTALTTVHHAPLEVMHYVMSEIWKLNRGIDRENDRAKKTGEIWCGQLRLLKSNLPTWQVV